MDFPHKRGDIYLGHLIPILNQSAIFIGSVVGFLNVLLPGVHPPRGHNKNRSFLYR